MSLTKKFKMPRKVELAVGMSDTEIEIMKKKKLLLKDEMLKIILEYKKIEA